MIWVQIYDLMNDSLGETRAKIALWVKTALWREKKNTVKSDFAKHLQMLF